MKYLLIIILSILLCSCQNTGDRDKWQRDPNLELDLTREIDRICNTIELKKQGTIRFDGYLLKGGAFNKYKPYVGEMDILDKNEIKEYIFVFFIVKNKTLFRSFVPYEYIS